MKDAVQVFRLAGEGKLKIGEFVEVDGKRMIVDKILEYHIGNDWAGNMGIYYKVKVSEG